MARKRRPFAYVPPNRPKRFPAGKYKNRPAYKAVSTHSRKATQNTR